MEDDRLNEQFIGARLSDVVRHVFAVQDVTLGQEGDKRGRTVRLRGTLRVEPARAYESIAPRFRKLGYTAFLRREGGLDVILAVPGVITPSPSRVWINVVLFLATVLSTLFVGALWAVEEPGGPFPNPLAGWPFAVSLMSILLAHEMGHYLAARYYDLPSTLPYFIPMPYSLLGTFGAFISMKAPVKNRRALLAIGAAGPLAGFVLAVPILILGLSLSEVTLIPLDEPVLMEGNSLLYAGIKILLFGRFLPSGGEDVLLHPVALAGWAGLLVTFLNLLPAGQLDGGHIIYALLGEHAKRLTWPIIIGLMGMGLLWNGWLLWAALLFFLGRRHTMLLDDITPLDGPRRAIAILVLIIFILIFCPVPMTIVGGG